MVPSKIVPEEEIPSHNHGKKTAAHTHPKVDLTLEEWDPKDFHVDKKLEKVPSKIVPEEEIPSQRHGKKTAAHTYPKVDLMHEEWDPKDFHVDKKLEKVSSKIVPEEEIPSQHHGKKKAAHTLHETDVKWDPKGVPSDLNLEKQKDHRTDHEVLYNKHLSSKQKKKSISLQDFDLEAGQEGLDLLEDNKVPPSIVNRKESPSQSQVKTAGSHPPHPLDLTHGIWGPRAVYLDTNLEKEKDPMSDYGFLYKEISCRQKKKKASKCHQNDLQAGHESSELFKDNKVKSKIIYEKKFPSWYSGKNTVEYTPPMMVERDQSLELRDDHLKTIFKQEKGLETAYKYLDYDDYIGKQGKPSCSSREFDVEDDHDRTGYFGKGKESKQLARLRKLLIEVLKKFSKSHEHDGDIKLNP
nr:PREDICTED: uncharacterized protein LOC102360541 [Latimeria chalumnae]|eukprot:XP_014353564.1 PREDICTED: uncharacterized protein LOC102360541 [Latimeria chalumnae]